jgi:hypothetical protein
MFSYLAEEDVNSLSTLPGRLSRLFKKHCDIFLS